MLRAPCPWELTRAMDLTTGLPFLGNVESLGASLATDDREALRSFHVLYDVCSCDIACIFRSFTLFLGSFLATQATLIHCNPGKPQWPLAERRSRYRASCQDNRWTTHATIVPQTRSGQDLSILVCNWHRLRFFSAYYRLLVHIQQSHLASIVTHRIRSFATTPYMSLSSLLIIWV